MNQDNKKSEVSKYIPKPPAPIPPSSLNKKKRSKMDDPDWGVCRKTCIDPEIMECSCKPLD
jgi:hypothetical protein